MPAGVARGIAKANEPRSVDALRGNSAAHDARLDFARHGGARLDAEDHNLFLTVQKRVLASLRNLRMRETVRSDWRSGSDLHWRLRLRE